MPPQDSAQARWFAEHLQPHEAMLRAGKPGLKVVCTSGCSSETGKPGFAARQGAHLLHKPCQPAALGGRSSARPWTRKKGKLPFKATRPGSPPAQSLDP